MISLVQYLLDTGNVFKVSNLLTYSLFFGVILYVLVYLYTILYNQDSLNTISWWIIPIILIDLAISFVYYSNLKKKDSDFTVENSELTMLDEEIDNDEAFLENEYEKQIVNDIVEDVEELKDDNIEILKEIEKEMTKEFQQIQRDEQEEQQIEEKKQKPKKKNIKKKEKNEESIKEMEINENITNNISLD